MPDLCKTRRGQCGWAKYRHWNVDHCGVIVTLLPCPSGDGIVIPNVQMTGASSWHSAKLGTEPPRKYQSRLTWTAWETSLGRVDEISARSGQTLRKTNSRRAKLRRQAGTGPDGTWIGATPNDHGAGSRRGHQSIRARADTTSRAEAPGTRRALPGRVFSPRVMTLDCSGSHKWGWTSWLICPWWTRQLSYCGQSHTPTMRRVRRSKPFPSCLTTSMWLQKSSHGCCGPWCMSWRGHHSPVPTA